MSEQGKLSIHPAPSEYAGKLVRLRPGIEHPSFDDLGGAVVRVADYYDRLAGRSWYHDGSRSVCLVYGLRHHWTYLPFDDEVLAVQHGRFVVLVHVEEVEAVEPEEERTHGSAEPEPDVDRTVAE